MIKFCPPIQRRHLVGVLASGMPFVLHSLPVPVGHDGGAWRMAVRVHHFLGRLYESLA
ncbi:MAG: hypothetical protein ABI293_06355 [Rhodanobacter sp.]